jgi:hypothetical protein
MDILEIEAGETYELMQDRMVFPEEGMRCQVLHCEVSSTFTSFKTYMNHWKEFHRPLISKFICSICKRRYSTRPHVIACIKKHPTQDPKSYATSSEIVSVPNPKFCDPGSVYPPRKGNRTERLEQQRKDAAEKRRKVAAYCKKHVYEEFVCRDDGFRYIFKEDGTSVAYISGHGRKEELYSLPPSEMDIYLNTFNMNC